MEKYRLLKQEECKVNSSFWNSYVKLIKEKVIPYQWEILNLSLIHIFKSVVHPDYSLCGVWIADIGIPVSGIY